MGRPLRSDRAPCRLLTEVELELMSILWGLPDGGTVNDVLAALPESRPLAYTSVSTILRILEQKGAVQSVKAGRSHIYRPLFDKRAYEVVAVKDVVGKLFGGKPMDLVRCLVQDGAISEAQLKALRTRLEKDGK